MKTTKKYRNTGSFFRVFSLTTSLVIILFSCEKIELPEAGSIEDLTPPSADFSATQTDDFKTYNFSNTSKSATDFIWDFGDGGSSTDKEPMHTFAAEGNYTVVLTASDKLNKNSSLTKVISVVEPPEPPAINPPILNGDFSNGQDDWKISSFTGGTRSPFNSSSDGDNLNYDGTDNGSKTPGAKYTNGTSAGPKLSGSTRYAYQALTVSPGRDYILEYSYAIKNDKTDIEGGDRVIVEILDGHFTDGVDARASSDAGPIIRSIGDIANGKGNFKLVKETFTAPETGLIAIWMYGITSEDAYIDNVKVYPEE